MADNKKMSVEDILAACRKQAGGASGATSSPAASTGAAPASDTAPAAEAPSGAPAVSEPAAEKPAAPAKASAPKAMPAKGAGMSIADIMAAARGEKKGDAAKPAAAPAAKAESVEKAEPAAKPAAAKAAAKPKSDAAPKPAAATAKPPALDTASILAAARRSDKPGPVSKAEAKEKGIPEAPVGKKKIEVPPPPPRPEFLKPKPAAAAEETRRGFFAYFTQVIVGSSLALGFASLAVTNLLWVLGLARFMFPNILTEPPTKFKAGFPDTLAGGQVDERFKAQFGVWIVKHEYEGQRQIFALKTVCTHLGCTPSWLEAEQKYKCPCHGSGFYKDGINFEGPAPRPLERYAIRIADDGQLEIDKSRVFHEELGQWSD
ncbi:MAG TPA: ubiquinol-cytochrome c reductase iron-sulfur subunit, partial [Pirellulaceae bacterium]|nr:ubiquinol-cytochrome c reductase iron-sulfur subunit [Pirellulaceae bacterium]